jgi:hypothetical protein
MQVDRIAVELRQRNGFESLDLGFAMYAAWHRALMRAWLVTYVPTAIVVSVVLWQYPTIAFAVMWWLKPLFDRVLLHVYANAMFGELPAARDVLRALPDLLLHTRLTAALTTFRLSMARSLFLPVWQLERQRGPPARARRRVLGARTYGYAVWLTFVCANVAGLWIMGSVVIARMLMPEEAAPLLTLADILDPRSLGVQHVLNVVAFVADTVIEPYFVGAGFSLYLNRRSELEGWDLEVEFRRMAQRHADAPATQHAPGAAAAAVVGAIVAALASMPLDTLAAGEPTPSSVQSVPLPQGAVKRELKAVLDDAVFGDKETKSRWVARTRESESTPAWLRSLRAFMKRVALALGEVGRIVIWVAGAAALGVALYFLIKHHERWRGGDVPRVVPQSMFGLDVRPASLPDDVASAARAALAAGDVVRALSLLYRGALSVLIHAAGVDFRSGDTEAACWRRAAPVLSADGAAYFRALLDAWLVTVYAHRPPPLEALERLCDRWPAHFRSDALTSAAPA